ncbi:MAG TPA: TlpA disulfide reductase family protein [Candidatus Dormibacteraeota bacterium]|nr:TlpA disulfide reductase family protein [Candidatus Dormibacteraeota bacterium]
MFERLLRRHKTAGPDAGSKAPDFSLATVEGGRFTLSESLGKGPAVIAFFKVSCPVCQLTLPFLDRLYQAYRGDSVTIQAVSQDNAEKSRLFAERFGVTFPVAIDGEGFPASKSYVFSQVPTIFLIDREGRIRFRSSGFSKAELVHLSAEIASLASRPPAPVFRASERVPEMRPG